MYVLQQIEALVGPVYETTQADSATGRTEGWGRAKHEMVRRSSSALVAEAGVAALHFTTPHTTHTANCEPHAMDCRGHPP